MKIGIVTFWWSKDNYGQLLQCYALQKYLKDLGHDSFVIKYDYHDDIKSNSLFKRILKAFNPVLLLKYLQNKKRIEKVHNEYTENNRHFDDFRNNNITFSKPEYKSFFELRDNPPLADIYIVGSDQVWNYRYFNLKRYINPLHVYFLDFGTKNIKRFSYAASWGRKKISSEYIKEIVPMLKKFDFISVREKTGIDLCKKCGRDDAEWVCDPTLLLTTEKYRDLYSGESIRKPKNQYILLYMLNNCFNFDIQQVYDYAKSKELEVVYITGNGKIDSYTKFFATIPEWLYLVDNAEFVITNSFHCVVFSTIFHKQFAVIPLCGPDKGMNARFESLFILRDTGDRFLKNNDFSLLEKTYNVKDVAVSEKFLKALNS